MTPDIYLVRHGQTEWNRDARLQGQLDSPLTPRGRAQARAAGRAMARLGLAGVPLSVSPLGRARATAALLAEEVALGPVVVEPRLQEVALGSWEGLTCEAIAAAHPDLVNGWSGHGYGFLCPDGEGYDRAAARVSAWLAEQKEPRIAVAHGMIGRVLRAVCTGLPRERAMAEPLPQNVIWRFHDGEMTVLAVD
jgi:probable phosphoglycerate mutase